MEGLTAVVRMLTNYDAKVDRSGACWIWTASLDADGYGRFTVARRPRLAHRVAFALAHGYMPPSTGAIDHLCRNRACVNPLHLEPVSRGENVRRGLLGKPKPYLVVTHCYRGHAYDEANTYHPPSGGRQCRACHAERERNHRRNAA